MYREMNDYELIYMVRENNIEDDIIFKKYDALINSVCKKYLSSALEIGLDYSDLYNEALNALYTAIHKYNENTSLFYTYANLCINTKIINLIRVHSSKKKVINNNLINYDDVERGLYSIENYVNYTEIDTTINEINNILKEYLYDLDYKSMPIFELFINGYSTREIAKLLVISCPTVKYYINKYRKDLKVLLNYK